MNITNFEDEIDNKILVRGKEYFKDDMVEDLEQTSDNIWGADIYGSDLYHISIDISGNNIVDWSCDCPYDWGPMCKHVAAVLYAIRKEMKQVPRKAVDKSSKKAKSKHKSKKEQLDEILAHATLEDFKEFITEQSNLNSKFENVVLSSLGYLVNDFDCTMKYTQIMKDVIRAALGRKGFIDYYNMPEFSENIRHLIIDAEKLASKKKYKEAGVACFCIVKEYAGIINEIDDSDGDTMFIFSDIVDFFDNNLGTIPGNIKNELFELFQKEAGKSKYSDYGLDEYLDKILISLVASPENKSKLLDVYTEALKNNSSYMIEIILDNIIALHRNTGDDEQAEKIIHDNIKFHKYRKYVIEKLIAQKNLEEAYKLAEEGLKISKPDKYTGNAEDSEDTLLKISELQKNRKKIMFWTEKRFESSSYNVAFYKKLKKMFIEQEWIAKSAKIISELKSSGYLHALQDIYYEEKMYIELLESLKTDDSIEIGIENQYLQKLKNRYPKEILIIYKQLVEGIMRQTGRKVYENAARLMQKMSRIDGGKDIVKVLLTTFREKYKNRPAMLNVFNSSFRNL